MAGEARDDLVRDNQRLTMLLEQAQADLAEVRQLAAEMRAQRAAPAGDGGLSAILPMLVQQQTELIRAMAERPQGPGLNDLLEVVAQLQEMTQPVGLSPELAMAGVQAFQAAQAKKAG